MKKWWCIELLVSKYALDPSTATCRNRPTSVNWCSVLYTVASETGTLARFASSKSTSAVTCRSPLANRIQPSAMRRLSRTLLGSPLLGRPLLGRPLLGQPLLGERGRRKSDWHWLFLDGLFHHAPIARPSGGDCCGRNQYTTVFRVATAAPASRACGLCGCGIVGMRLCHAVPIC